MKDYDWEKLNQMANSQDDPKPKLWCPGCGEVLTDIQVFTGGFDVYCDKCLWSGDIMPDEKI